MACNCLFSANFCESTTSDSFVFRGEIIQKYDGPDFTTYLDIKLVEAIKGNGLEENYTIVSYNTSCDVFFDQFEVGDEIVTKFLEISEPDGSANYDLFSFDYCSTSFLKIEGNQVVGNISDEISERNYEDFKNSINHCVDITMLNRSEELLERFVFTYPNPTSDFVYVYFYNDAKLSGELFNSMGQLIDSMGQLDSNAYQFDFRRLPVGVYFVRISLNDVFITRRFVKR